MGFHTPLKSSLATDLHRPILNQLNIKKAHELKTSRYGKLQSQIVQEGYQCHLNCIEVGFRGLVTADNVEQLGESFTFIGGRPRSKRHSLKI